MNSAGKIAVLILLTAFVAGCSHKTKAAPPPAAQAPTLPVSTLAKDTPPPQLPPPKAPKIAPPATESTPPPAPPKPHKTNHHKPKAAPEPTPAEQPPAKDQTASQPAATTEQASTAPASDVSPIGQLSAAGESTDTPARLRILDEINSTETGLNNIKRALSSDEQTTAAQIRTYLAKAKEAMQQEDLDGAHTLVTKAKVLLDELIKP
ncbi:MAG: hypothetical protein WA400_13155 [Silvibacterium sp.]